MNNKLHPLINTLVNGDINIDLQAVNTGLTISQFLMMVNHDTVFYFRRRSSKNALSYLIYLTWPRSFRSEQAVVDCRTTDEDRPEQLIVCALSGNIVTYKGYGEK